jgi:hypothetical protein
MKKYRDPVPWRDIGRLATVLGVALIVYTVAVALASPDQLFDWLNTLVATVLSVFSALVVGLVLFRFQTKEADAKKREELAALLEVELAELEREFMASRTVVPDGILEDLRSSAFHEIRLSIHHPHPLAIEEAIRSGLFDAQLTAGMLVLAREMKAHNLFLGEATSLEPHMERAFAAGLGRRSNSCLRLYSLECVEKLFGKSDELRNRGSEGGQDVSKCPDRPLLAAESEHAREACGYFPNSFGRLILRSLGACQTRVFIHFLASLCATTTCSIALYVSRRRECAVGPA